MDTTSIVRRLRDGAPCLDAKNNGACHSREPLAGCDCTIAANKIESDAKVISALREALGQAFDSRGPDYVEASWPGWCDRAKELMAEVDEQSSVDEPSEVTVRRMRSEWPDRQS